VATVIQKKERLLLYEKSANVLLYWMYTAVNLSWYVTLQFFFKVIWSKIAGTVLKIIKKITTPPFFACIIYCVKSTAFLKNRKMYINKKLSYLQMAVKGKETNLKNL
jgi:hypothetical protein